jgi:glycosyltransferase involved in cell wall biosynthesis
MKKVSVQVLAYEHEKCIERCLNSILDQNFSNYEIVVGIDKSLDRTKELVYKIAKTSKVPINIIDHKIRVGAFNNFIGIKGSCQGKYIAICDGDDYWTDRNKLEKQFTFMEENSNLIASFHDSYLVNSNNDIVAKLPLEKHRSKSYSQSYLIENESFMPSSSIMFKNISLKNFFYIFNDLDNIVDLPLVIYLLEFGEIGYIEQNMSNYVQASNLNAFTSKDVSFRDIEGLKMFDLINTYTKFR